MKNTTAALILLAITLFAGPDSRAGSLQDIKRSVSVNKENAEAALDVMKEIGFTPSPALQQFWSQRPDDLKMNNPFGEWKETASSSGEVTLTLENPQGFAIWGLAPEIITARFSEGKLSLVRINAWNKGDSGWSQYAPTLTAFQKAGSRLQAAGFAPSDEHEKMSSYYKIRWKVYAASPTEISLAFEKNEYLYVRLCPAARGPSDRPAKTPPPGLQDEKAALMKNLEKNVARDKSGDVYIRGIPMLDQGEKGYCAPATCARVLLYYGIDVDMHLVAEMMNTGRGSGTTTADLEHSLKRLCRDNPFIWGVPGHLRLIRGVNAAKKQIVYSDTWGDWADSSRMTYGQAREITEVMYVLQ
jgi:hypothetical protein